MNQWLRCTVYPGQFSVEFAVVIRQFDGRDVSLFAPRELVQCAQQPEEDQGVPGWLQVRLVEQEGDLVLVHLPRSTLENGQYITVKADQVQAQHQPA
jgi:hypothetical protein